jgi:hypothetical protein
MQAWLKANSKGAKQCRTVDGVEDFQLTAWKIFIFKRNKLTYEKCDTLRQNTYMYNGYIERP